MYTHIVNGFISLWKMIAMLTKFISLTFYFQVLSHTNIVCDGGRDKTLKILVYFATKKKHTQLLIHVCVTKRMVALREQCARLPVFLQIHMYVRI